MSNSVGLISFTPSEDVYKRQITGSVHADGDDGFIKVHRLIG